MHEDLAEAPGQRLVLGGIELLVTEEDHAVIQQRPPDAGDGGVVEVLTEIDAVDLGAERAGDGMDLQSAHAHSPAPTIPRSPRGVQPYTRRARSLELIQSTAITMATVTSSTVEAAG